MPEVDVEGEEEDEGRLGNKRYVLTSDKRGVVLALEGSRVGCRSNGGR